MNKRLLIATYHRLDENTGGCNGSKGFIHCLASLFNDCSLVCQAFPNAYTYIPHHVKVYPYYEHRNKLRLAFDIYRGVIFGLYYALREHLKTHHYDIIVIDHSMAGAAVMPIVKATGAKIITIHHNVERDYLDANRHKHALTYRIPYIHYAKKAERDCLTVSDINLTVTQRDADTFHSWYPDIHVYDWGNFEYRPIADKHFPKGDRGQTFIITGSLNFEQSLLPITDFIRRFWPLVCHAYPQARLLIAGRQPAAELQQLCEAVEGIILIPNPDDMAAVVQQADYYICPISVGSGRKMRVLDGLKQGLPVLCHEVSAAGYEAVAASGCLFAYHDEPTFMAALRQMLATPPDGDTVYQAFKQSFSISTGVERLRHILKQENIL